jgi:two-component system OmpR family response regulator
MQITKTGILIHERRCDALCRLHVALSKLGYVREEETGRSTIYTYRRASAKHHRKVAKIMLDFKRHTVHAGRKSVTLNNHERLLLKYLVEHPCNTLPRDAIPAKVFGNNEPSGSDTISPCVCTLRRKLESIGHANVIKTIRGTGYRLSQDYLTRISLS